MPLTITEEAGWLVAEEYEGGGNQVTLSMIYKLDDCLSRGRRLDGKQHTELSGARRRGQATAWRSLPRRSSIAACYKDMADERRGLPYLRRTVR